MKKSPKLAIARYSKEEMQRLYVQNQFPELLRTCQESICHDEELAPGTSLLYPDTVRIKIKKWKLDGITVATIAFYTHQDGSTTQSIRMLRAGEEKFHATQRFPF